MKMENTEKKSARKVAVITGASAGVGRATVREFAAHGYDVGLIARGVDGLEAARKEVESAGGKAVVLPLDVSDPKALEAAAERVEFELGPIDVWVNDAMVSVFAPVIETSPEEYRRVTEVTYLGAVYGTLAALRRMTARNRGVIVQVSSALAYRSIPLQSAYCAAKHAVLGFTESLRTELLHDKSAVRVTLVHLPAVNTPQFDWSRSKLPNRPQPVPPIFQPEVPARAIRYAAEHPRKEFDLGYPTVKAILGEKFASGYADRYLARTGYDSQQTDEPVSANRRENFWEPVPGDAGAHGRFDDRARDSSWEFWLDTHRGWLAAGAAAIGVGAWALAGRKDRAGPPSTRA
jgi:NAD(P)-dependent dehydrogenase (short-subunit alcohol dehydrogenase family)